MSVSVCMAVHNGEKYLREQLESIISQLAHDDEIIVIDDASKDGSAALIESYADPRIKLLRSPTNIGVNAAFEKAISHATQNTIVLADQDDVWPSGRLAKLVNSLSGESVTCVVGNQSAIDVHGRPIAHGFSPTSIEGYRKPMSDIFQIFSGHSPYYGCCMAFNAKLKALLLPFPSKMESHDLWIALCSAIVGRNASTTAVVTHRRVHGSNLSILRRPIFEKLKSRIIFLDHIFSILLRLLKTGGKP